MSDITIRRSRHQAVISGVTSKGNNFLEDNMTSLTELCDGRVQLIVQDEFADELEGYFKEKGLKVEIER